MSNTQTSPFNYLEVQLPGGLTFEMVEVEGGSYFIIFTLKVVFSQN